jgi:hypothetical protein
MFETSKTGLHGGKTTFLYIPWKAGSVQLNRQLKNGKIKGIVYYNARSRLGLRVASVKMFAMICFIMFILYSTCTSTSHNPDYMSRVAEKLLLQIWYKGVGG